MVIISHFNPEPACHDFLKEAESVHIVRKAPKQIIASHINNKNKFFISNEELKSKCARNIARLMASGAVINASHGLTLVGVFFEQMVDMVQPKIKALSIIA